MEARELRVDNLVLNNGELCVVTAISHSGTITVDTPKGTSELVPDDLLKGVPLTEEWLLKFGFRKAAMYFDVDKLCLVKFTDGKFHMSGRESLIVEHVHQLQNLYFALTAEELTAQ